MGALLPREDCAGLVPITDTDGDNQFLPTPPEATVALMRAETWFRQPRRILEPAVGDGAIADILLRAGHQVYGSDIVDRGWCNEGQDRAEIADFLKAPLYHFEMSNGRYGHYTKAEGLVTNPPFRQGQAFIERAVKNFSYVAMLLPAGWFNEPRPTKNGPPLWERYRPARVYIIPWRLDFLRLGRSPGRNLPCNWYVWDTNHDGGTVTERLNKPILGGLL